MDKKTLSMAVLVIGIVILVASLFADNIGIGDVPGFGSDQLAGSVFGAIVLVAGILLIIKTR